MGTWGIGFFEGDTGEDWLDTLTDSDLDEQEIAEEIADAIHTALELADEPLLEAPVCEDAVIAAELLAAAAGYPGAELPRRAVTWARGAATPGPDLLDAARSAVRASTGERSELAALSLDDATDGERRLWDEQVADLLERLDGAIAAPVVRQPRRRRSRPKPSAVAPGDLVELTTRHENHVYLQAVAVDDDVDFGREWVVRVFAGAFAKRPADLAALAAEPEMSIVRTELDDPSDRSPVTVVGSFPVPHVERDRRRRREALLELVDEAAGWVAGIGSENLRS